MKNRFFSYSFLPIIFILSILVVLFPIRTQEGIITVNPGDDLQAIINSASPCSDLIFNGGEFVGNFFINKCMTWKGHASFRTPNTEPALFIHPNTDGVNIFGDDPTHTLDFRTTSLPNLPDGSFGKVDTVVKVGDVGTSQDTVDEAPTGVFFRFVTINGLSDQQVKRGLSLNCGNCGFFNGSIREIHVQGQDTQAIGLWNAPGPIFVTDSFLEAAGENFMTGGADPSIRNIITRHVEIRRNHFFKPLHWNPADPSFIPLPPPPGAPWLDHWSVKNLFELKEGDDVIIDRNLFENCWLDAQVGFAILIKSANQDGECTGCVTRNVSFTNNIIKNVDHGINLVARDFNSADPPDAPVTDNVDVINNLWLDVKGIWFQNGGAQNVTLAHNTHPGEIQIGNTMSLYGIPSQGFVVRDNLGMRTGFGIKGDSAVEGTISLEIFTPEYIYARNVLVGANSSMYPSNNFYPNTMNEVQLGEDFRLLPTSPFKNTGTDGMDPGWLGLPSEPTPSPTPTATATPTPIPSPSPNPSPCVRLPNGKCKKNRNIRDFSIPNTSKKIVYVRNFSC